MRANAARMHNSLADVRMQKRNVIAAAVASKKWQIPFREMPNVELDQIVDELLSELPAPDK